jgi:hypothetical protein
MQIRERNGKTEYLRAWYDKEAQRTRQKLVKPEDFTAEEKTQADAYHAARAEARQNDLLRLYTEDAHVHIEKMAAGLAAGRRPLDLNAFWASLAHLRRELRKAGLTQPRPSKTPTPESK